jgi:hypothetical protein
VNPHLASALAAAAGRIPPERIEQVWLFPARQAGPRETALAVLSVRAGGPGEGAGAQRTIHTVRYRAEEGKDGRVLRTDETAEHGTVPPDRVGRIIDGVLRRLEEPETPEVRDTGGDPRLWAELLAELLGTELDPAYQE